ncbi:hypothetical protein ASPACDRAFT_64134 [Aspergillus aculeatus ATCC 16872]|uniref:SCP domain-containing protein n=1 Tax=Aspergillus aculeatus (strain ATCC 16872 / CBS 172.66 / WB 5094) TaxID=690307 RepID=A0A1L9WHM0_ASPA1|nr:uncharacterized protein ASPACDRAFT_64134 [Aspergillus aculeatus ATCC 16872]OJJ95646.1 hypothetical protein ASPACDRAFT_64134 [Aspergillus aculeatus ATCC 16872]
MVGLQILRAIILGAVMTQASSVSIHNITFAHNFATEALNAATPYVNLSEFGYHGGQLPKVYALNQSNHGVDYLPEESFAEFRGIIAGINNASAAFSAEQEALVGTSSSTTTTTKRTTTNAISMLLRNSAGEGNTYAVKANHKICHTGTHAPWHYVVVYWIKEAYITFWKSDACNGSKGSFNPVCDYYDDPSEVCVFNFSPKSFRVYSGCHHSYGWGDGCEAHTL